MSLKIWVFVMIIPGAHGVFMELMRFVVIEFSKTILSVNILFGVLVLGEENGVRGQRRLERG